MQNGLRGVACERHRQTVDELPALTFGQPPVFDRGHVADDIADTAPHQNRRCGPDQSKIDDHADRHGHAERPLAVRVLE